MINNIVENNYKFQGNLLQWNGIKLMVVITTENTVVQKYVVPTTNVDQNNQVRESFTIIVICCWKENQEEKNVLSLQDI